MTVTPAVRRYYAEPIETEWSELIAAWPNAVTDPTLSPGPRPARLLAPTPSAFSRVASGQTAGRWSLVEGLERTS